MKPRSLLLLLSVVLPVFAPCPDTRELPCRRPRQRAVAHPGHRRHAVDGLPHRRRRAGPRDRRVQRPGGFPRRRPAAGRDQARRARAHARPLRSQRRDEVLPRGPGPQGRRGVSSQGCTLPAQGHRSRNGARSGRQEDRGHRHTGPFSRVGGVLRQGRPLHDDGRRHRLQHGLDADLNPAAHGLPGVGEEARGHEGRDRRVVRGASRAGEGEAHPAVHHRHADRHREGAGRHHRDQPLPDGEPGRHAGPLRLGACSSSTRTGSGNRGTVGGRG